MHAGDQLCARGYFGGGTIAGPTIGALLIAPMRPAPVWPTAGQTVSSTFLAERIDTGTG